MSEFTRESYPLVAGERFVMHETGRYFTLENAVTDLTRVELRDRRGGWGVTENVPEGLTLEPGRDDLDGENEFTEFALTSPIDQTVTVITSTRPVTSNRVSLGGSIEVEAPAGFQDAADVWIVSSTAAAIVPENLNRKRIHLTLIAGASTAGVRIGTASVAANRGQWLEIGQSVTLEGTAALYGSSAGVSQLSILEEIN